MKTLFLEWKNLGSLWSAKDPIDCNRRWIVRLHSQTRNYELLWVQNGIENFICNSQSIDYLFWVACGRRITQVSEQFYVTPHYYTGDVVKKMGEFLASMSEKEETNVNT